MPSVVDFASILQLVFTTCSTICVMEVHLRYVGRAFVYMEGWVCPSLIKRYICEEVLYMGEQIRDFGSL